jgi:hypothetical protein
MRDRGHDGPPFAWDEGQMEANHEFTAMGM